MENENVKVIATKEDERKALLKIQKIVSDLGENSYLSAAFSGVWEVAQSNIENDWGCSLENFRNMYEEEKGKNIQQEKFVAELKSSNESLLIDLNISRELYGDKVDENFNLSNYVIDLKATIANKDLLLAEKSSEIISLKAKLYDLLSK